jgi:hypothetical protein
MFSYPELICVFFDDSSIENSRREIIARRRQVEWVFSVSHIAVFGNELSPPSHHSIAPSPLPTLPSTRLSPYYSKPRKGINFWVRARCTSPSLPSPVIIIIKNSEFNSSFSTSLSISRYLFVG